MDSGTSEDQLARQIGHRFCVIDFMLLTLGRHCIGGAPENLEIH
jgi:hypothetical protein